MLKLGIILHPWLQKCNLLKRCL